MPVSKPAITRARRLAEDAANRYFAELTWEIPSDGGEVNLVDEVIEIQQAIRDGYEEAAEDDGDNAALNAGYLLGIAVGRRLAGAR